MSQDPKPSLRQIETRDELHAEATYEVLVDGKAVGTVTKYVEPRWSTPKGKLKEWKETNWAWERDYRSDGLGYEHRADAVKWLLQAVKEEAM